MTRHWTKLIVFVLLLAAAGCGGGGGSLSLLSDSTDVTIALGVGSSGGPVTKAVPSGVASVRITVNAADMLQPVTTTVPVSPGGTVSVTLSIPSGLNRCFIVEALDSQGNVLYTGYAFRDLTGAATQVDISVLLASWISGVVKNAASGALLPGVSVDVYSHGVFISSVTTGSNGSYQVPLPQDTDFRILFHAAGFLSATYAGVSTHSGTTTFLETVLQVDVAHSGNGDASGTVVNALNGYGVNGLTINLRAGINTTTGAILATTTTSGSGNYGFSGIPAGNYTGEASGTGYGTVYFSIVVVGGTATAGQNATITPVLLPGQTRIVLTWGSTPRDLDSHLTGPDGAGGRFHTWYGNRYFPNSTSPYANLDRDVTSGYGPETTTIDVQFAGTYRFSVHDYTNLGSSTSMQLSNSGAQVKVYRGSGLAASFNVPINQGGTLWTVFTMDNSSITPVNAMTYWSSPSGIMSVGGSASSTDAALIANLPAK